MGGTQETRSQSDEQSAFLLSITLVTPIHGQQPGKRLHRRNSPDARGEYTKLVLARQRRLRSAGKAFSIEDIMPKEEETEEIKPEPEKKTSREWLEVPDRTPPAVDRMLTDGVTANDFEIVWKSDSLANMDRHLSCAEIILNKANRKLGKFER